MKRVWIYPFLLLLTGCSNITVLDPKSTTGKEQAFLIWFGLAIMTAVLVTVFILFTHIVRKYRYTKAKKGYIPHDVKGNLKFELMWLILPIILLTALAIPTVVITFDQSPVAEAESDKDGTHIQVTARQFEWTFTYDSGKEEHNILILPEGEPVILHLSSEDVIHSFWVPALAGKTDLIPGKQMVYEIKNPEKGTYSGKCAEYCGIQHANMTFKVKVVSKQAYERYIKQNHKDPSL